MQDPYPSIDNASERLVPESSERREQEETVLRALDALSIQLPPNNPEVKKVHHNATIENYCKLALITAENSQYLQTYLEVLLTQAQAETLSTQKASDILLLWGPVAEIIGWEEGRSDLEDLAFARFYPQEKADIETAYVAFGGREALEALRARRVEEIENIVEPFLGVPNQAFTVNSRQKSIYSIWRKAQYKHLPNYTVNDFLAFRVVINHTPNDEEQAIQQCYQVRDELLKYYEFEVDGYDDYVTDKPYSPGGDQNAYKSFHLDLLDDEGKLFECQLRTRGMQERNETHWAYNLRVKPTPGRVRVHGLKKAPAKTLSTWRDLAAKDIQARHQVGNSNLEGLFPDSVFVFSPDNNLYQLKAGNTALDFAFKVHSDKALAVQRIYVNGHLRSFDHPVTLRDEILLVYAPHDAPTWTDNWTNLVTSPTAQDRLRKARLVRDREIYINRATEEINETCKALGITKPFELLSETDKESIAKRYGLKDFETVLRQIGGKVKETGPGKLLRQILIKAQETGALNSSKPNDGSQEAKPLPPNLLRDGFGVAILDSLGFPYRFAGCCSDVTHHEPVVALISRIKTTTFSIHRDHCVNVAHLREVDERAGRNTAILPCKWYKPRP